MPAMLLRMLALVWLAAAPLSSFAQTPYPSKPIRVVVPFGAGSNTDNLARRFAEKTGPALGTTFVVINKPGANGLIAAQEVMAAPNDGYTIMMSSASAHAANAYLYKSLGYDPVADFSPISGVTINPAVIVVRADLPVQNVKQLIEYGKANPGKLNIGSGNTSALASVSLLRSMGGFTGIDVPFKSPPDVISELLAGRIDLMSTDWVLVKPHVTSGKLRVLGVTSKARMPGLPNIPTVAETIPGFELNGWVAAFAPAATPPEVLAKLSKAIGDWINAPDFQKYAEEQGMIGFATSPADLAKFQREQIRHWSDVFARAGIPRGE